MSLAIRISTTRKARGMTMSTLAQLCDVSPTAVSNWESGNTTPREESLAAVARSLGVTVEFLQSGSTGTDVAMDVRSILNRAKEQLAIATGTTSDQVKLSFSMEA